MSHRTSFHSNLFAHTALICVLVLLCTLSQFPKIARAVDEPSSESGTSGVSTDATPDTTPTTDPDTNTPEGTADITTGDSSSTLDAHTTANSNETNTDIPAGSTIGTSQANDATVETTGAVESTTGDNAAQALGGASVTSGSAYSVANIVNVINTNIFNSEGLLSFLNVLMGNVSLDLRHAFSILTRGIAPNDAPPCSLTSCASSDTTVTVNNQNAAAVDTTLIVTASTGSNTATGDGDSTIATGDAYASANVVNVVNTNITNSNYLLLSVNNFGAFGGDIVFPGSEWFRDLLSQSTSRNTETTLTNTNQATVTTDGTVVADTGSNTATGDTATGDTATITTGDAHASANIVNQVNTNLFGDSMLFLFRIHGSWAGNIFGLPDGMTWREGSQGVELFLDPSGVSAPQGSTERLSVTNNNTATVTNNVSVYALTGENHATSTEDGATITTGDAYASANIVNVVNTNVLGRNWVLAIFNIFGDWSGNISFGQPDLWVGARAVVPSNVRGGDCFDYEVTVNNLGDAVATDVALSGTFNVREQTIASFGTTETARTPLKVGRIEPGGTRLLTLRSCMMQYVPGGTTVVTGFTATSRETDSNKANNSDTIGVTMVPGASGSALRLGASQLSVTKSTNRSVITASTSVDYTLVIKNSGGPVYNALLVDTIYNAEGVPMHEQRWGLGTIAAHEEITVSYTTSFNGSTTPGIYKNEAFIFGIDRHPDIENNLGNEVTSPTASVNILVRAQKAVDEAPSVCVPLITSYIKYGQDNDEAEVRNLQSFLRTIEKNSSVNVTGVYDEATFEAVRSLQEKYAADILTPWGTTRTTGFVYYTTQKKINEIWCNTAFPLAPEQVEEIEAFKTRIQRAPIDTPEDIPLPDTEYEEIGMAPLKEDDTRIAQNDPVPAPLPHPTQGSALTQVAAVSQVYADDGVQGIWETIKSGVTNILSWLGL